MKRLLAAGTLVLALTAGHALAVSPAQAVGTKNGKCTHYDSFVGTSTVRGSSSTSGEEKLCGKVRLRVKYNASGGTALWTLWVEGKGRVIQPGVGYDVFQGQHSVTNPTLGASPTTITT